GAPPASATRLGSCLPQTHIPDESARITPPWLSSPTPASRLKLTLKSREKVSVAQGGPKKTPEVDHFRMPKSDRTHLGLGKDIPGGRAPASPPSTGYKVISLPRLGGLHHRYT